MVDLGQKKVNIGSPFFMRQILGWRARHRRGRRFTGQT